jgi:micrococcal nuclease
MRKLLHPVVGLFLLGSATALRGAEVYRWTDEKGRTHYSDRRVQGADHLPVRQEIPFRTVKRVYDGDTFVLDDGAKVRLLGVNAPEIERSGKDGQAGGEEARRWLESRLAKHPVRLEQDAEPKDKYGRLLAHVFTDSGEHVNRALAEAGLAFVDIHPPNLKYVEPLTAAQQHAEAAQRGVWGMPEYAAKPVAVLEQRRLRGFQRLLGTPTRINDTRAYRKLVFSDKFEVNIRKEYLPLFPPIETYLRKRLEVRGWLSRRKDHYSIAVRHPSGLVVR